MPVYTYRRDDGTTFEIQQRFSDEPLTVDPTTGQKVVRIVSAPSIIFKGSGFYATDHKKGSTSASSRSSTSEKSDDSSGTKSETKSEPAAPAASEAKSDAKTPASSAAD